VLYIYTSGSSFSASPARRDRFVAGRKPPTYSFGDVWIADVQGLFRADWKGMTPVGYGKSGLRKIIYRRPISVVWFFLSDAPSVCGCQAVDMRSFVFRQRNTPLQNLETNFRSLSEIIPRRTPQSSSNQSVTQIIAQSSAVYLLYPGMSSVFLLALQDCAFHFAGPVSETTRELV
jgi:hypothetical protein